MLRERLTEDIYVFTSSRYVEVTATVIFTQRGVVVFDTLPFPSETREMRRFIERAQRGDVRYVILSHSHADHVYGAYQFPEAEVVGHRKCYELLLRYGNKGLQEAQKAEPELNEVVLRHPALWVEDNAALHLGNKTITLFHSPGHTPDLIAAYIEEERTMLASDTMMPIPYIVDGDPEDLIRSLETLKQYPMEHLVQGHGEVLLRGEIEEQIDSNIAYLEKLIHTVREAVREGRPVQELLRIPLEDFGKSRVPLEGLVVHLHRANVVSLYERELQRLKRARQKRRKASSKAKAAA
ncbi:MAG: MBL fold metallo-hydrolase [Chloroflexi bacterium]|nr:MBL fold metallo-hydrolase [Chloroflexota bacterium]